jgi:CBS domain-containing protein
MRVSSLTGDSVVFVSADADLLEVCDALTKNEIGAIAIGDGSRPIGVVSERDVVRALAERRDPAATRASDVATTSLVWCDASSGIGEVAAEMMDNYVRHVLVESHGKLVGIVSARDVLGAYVADGT